MRKYAKYIHLICKSFRSSIGITQNEVAAMVDYSVENVSAFERGRNRNYEILLWYIDHGLTEDFCEKWYKLHGGIKNEY